MIRSGLSPSPPISTAPPQHKQGAGSRILKRHERGTERSISVVNHHQTWRAVRRVGSMTEGHHPERSYKRRAGVARSVVCSQATEWLSWLRSVLSSCCPSPAPASRGVTASRLTANESSNVLAWTPRRCRNCSHRRFRAVKRKPTGARVPADSSSHSKDRRASATLPPSSVSFNSWHR